MPRKIVSEQVGTGMTAYTRRKTVFDFTRPMNGDDCQAFDEMLDAVAPRDYVAYAIGVANATLEAIKSGDTHPDDFVERVGMGWYSKEILRRATRLKSEIDVACRPDQIVRLAFQIGCLLTEAEMRWAWNEQVEKARLFSEARESANRRNRKADPVERARIVAEIMAEKKCSTGPASKIAAKRFPEKGAWTTFRDSYNARKVSDA